MAFFVVTAVIDNLLSSLRLQRMGVGHILEADQIAFPHDSPVYPRGIGSAVNHPFHREAALRMASAAHRGRGHLVGMRHDHVQRVIGNNVRAEDRRRRTERDIETARGIGPLIMIHLDREARGSCPRRRGPFQHPRTDRVPASS